jgi:predicted DNA-binding transcriptional regulator AlpA
MAADQTARSTHHTVDQSVSNELLTLAEYAKKARAPIDTVRYWRKVGYGPQGFRLGRRVVYRASEVDAFIDQCRHEASA